MTSSIKRKSSIKKSLKKNVHSRKSNSKTSHTIMNMSGGSNNNPNIMNSDTRFKDLYKTALKKDDPILSSKMTKEDVDKYKKKYKISYVIDEDDNLVPLKIIKVSGGILTKPMYRLEQHNTKLKNPFPKKKLLSEINISSKSSPLEETMSTNTIKQELERQDLVKRQEAILKELGPELTEIVEKNITLRRRGDSGIGSSGSRSSGSSKKLGYGYKLNLNTGTSAVNNPSKFSVNSMGYSHSVVDDPLYVEMNATRPNRTSTEYNIAKHSHNNLYEVIDHNQSTLDYLHNLNPNTPKYVNIDPITGDIYRSNSHYVNFDPNAIRSEGKYNKPYVNIDPNVNLKEVVEFFKNQRNSAKTVSEHRNIEAELKKINSNFHPKPFSRSLSKKAHNPTLTLSKNQHSHHKKTPPPIIKRKSRTSIKHHQNSHA